MKGNLFSLSAITASLAIIATAPFSAIAQFSIPSVPEVIREQLPDSVEEQLPEAAPGASQPSSSQPEYTYSADSEMQYSPAWIPGRDNICVNEVGTQNISESTVVLDQTGRIEDSDERSRFTNNAYLYSLHDTYVFSGPENDMESVITVVTDDFEQLGITIETVEPDGDTARSVATLSTNTKDPTGTHGIVFNPNTTTLTDGEYAVHVYSRDDSARGEYSISVVEIHEDDYIAVDERASQSCTE